MHKENIQEELLEDIPEDVLNRYSDPAFLMTSAMNVERIITGYNAHVLLIAYFWRIYILPA